MLRVTAPPPRQTHNSSQFAAAGPRCGTLDGVGRLRSTSGPWESAMAKAERFFAATFWGSNPEAAASESISGL